MADARSGRIPDIAAKTRLRRDGAYSVDAPVRRYRCRPPAARAACSPQARTAAVSQYPHAINSHTWLKFDAAGTNYGRVALGLPSENLTL